MDRLQANLSISVLAQAALAALLVFLFTSSTLEMLFQIVLLVGLHGLAQGGLTRLLEAPLDEKRSTWWMVKTITMRSLAFAAFMELFHSISHSHADGDFAISVTDFLKTSVIMGCALLAVAFVLSWIYRSKQETEI